jgi:hypothetical protein
MYCYANQNTRDGTKLRARVPHAILRFASYPSKDSSDAIRTLFEESFACSICHESEHERTGTKQRSRAERNIPVPKSSRTFFAFLYSFRIHTTVHKTL